MDSAGWLFSPFLGDGNLRALWVTGPRAFLRLKKNPFNRPAPIIGIPENARFVDSLWGGRLSVSLPVRCTKLTALSAARPHRISRPVSSGTVSGVARLYLYDTRRGVTIFIVFVLHPALHVLYGMSDVLDVKLKSLWILSRSERTRFNRTKITLLRNMYYYYYNYNYYDYYYRRLK